VSVEWRRDAPKNLIKLAVGKALQAQMDQGKWLELGLLTDTSDRITNHPRLLRSLRFGDDDYDGCVLDVVPAVLGEPPAPAFPRWPTPPEPSLREAFPNLDVVSDFLDLPAWLALENPQLFDRVFTAVADVEAGDATMPDGTVLSAAEAAAARLEVGEMRRQVERIRRDFADDPEAAVGQAKELIESVCKTILGLTGDAAQGREDLPKLVSRTLAHLGLDSAQLAGDDAVEVRAAKRMLGGVSSVLNGAGELRNARGTGHGRSGTPVVDAALARLTVGVVLPSVVYLIEVFESQTDHPAAEAPDLVDAPSAGPSEAGSTSPAEVARPTTAEPAALPDVAVGNFVVHRTFGEGQVIAVDGPEPLKQVVTVEFGGDVGRKRLLLRYADLRVRPSAGPR